jgi:hypothetical protein
MVIPKGGKPPLLSDLTNNLSCQMCVGRRLRLKCDGTRAENNFVFRRNGRVHLNRRGRQFSRLQAADVCASAVVMVDTLCSEAVWRGTHSIRQFPLYFPSRSSSCAITFQLDYTSLQVKIRITGDTVPTESHTFVCSRCSGRSNHEPLQGNALALHEVA